MNIDFIVLLMTSLAMLGTMAIFRWKAHIEDTKIIINGTSPEILKFPSDFATDVREIQQNPDPLELVLAITKSAIEIKNNEIEPLKNKTNLVDREKKRLGALESNLGALNEYKKNLENYKKGILTIRRLFNWPFYFSCLTLIILFFFALEFTDIKQFLISIKIIESYAYFISYFLRIILPLINIAINLLFFYRLFNFKVRNY